MNIKQTLIATTATAAGLLGATGMASADQVTVKSGDTLASIAQTHDTTIDSLAQINHISNVDVIFAGDTLETEGQVNTNVQAPVQQAQAQPVVIQAPTPKKAQATSVAPAQPAVTAPVQQQTSTAPVQSTPSASAGGSTYDQFIANGGSAALWNSVVMPESGGNANAVSPNGYRGLGQTKEGWGTGSVAQQTQGMVNYANSRYGSVSNAVQFRSTHGYW